MAGLIAPEPQWIGASRPVEGAHVHGSIARTTSGFAKFGTMRKSDTNPGAGWDPAGRKRERPPARKPAPKARAPLTERILAVLRAIPNGKVASYGQVAALAGSPRGARQVARVLHSLSEKEKLPWHRVVGVSGRISLPAEASAEQARRLRREGVPVDASGKLDWARCRWKPLG